MSKVSATSGSAMPFDKLKAASDVERLTASSSLGLRAEGLNAEGEFAGAGSRGGVDF